MVPKKAVLLVGSPRGDQSASRALAGRILQGLSARGLAVETHSIHAAHLSEEKKARMAEAVDSADVLLFAFPLYVDHLPAPVIRALDEIAARRRGTKSPSRPLLAALVQCGFPERHQNFPAVDIMRRFACLNGFEWAGGLTMGMGGAASGRPLPEKPSGVLRNVIQALDAAAAALAEGRPVPAETIDLMGRKLMPRGLYFAVANWHWKRMARKNSKKLGRAVDLYARPYA